MEIVKTRLRILAFLPAVAVALACGTGKPESTLPGPAAEAPTRPTAEAEAEIERLRALGYVDYSPERAAPEDRGVTVYDERRTYPGYNLYPVRPLGRAELIDLDGNVLHSWTDRDSWPWSRSLLLANGDLLVVLLENGLLHLAWDNRVLAHYPLPAHHDVRPAPDGRFVTLTQNPRSIDLISTDVPTADNALTFFGPGVEVESHSLYDTIAASPDVLSFRHVEAKKDRVDLIHANSVRFMTDARLAERHPLYALGNILICMRNQDAIAVLDPGGRKLIWAWGQGELEGPHDATLLPSGNILIFDNGVRRMWSRVIEIDPMNGEIVWQYRAIVPTDFFTRARGAAQRLPNGNTLITESNEGHAFEVTPEGEIVWEFFVPHLDRKGHRATIIRLYRYETDFVERLLAD
jgi:hypothetical protein